jgi:hypothetical protein
VNSHVYISLFRQYEDLERHLRLLEGSAHIPTSSVVRVPPALQQKKVVKEVPPVGSEQSSLAALPNVAHVPRRAQDPSGLSTIPSTGHDRSVIIDSPTRKKNKENKSGDKPRSTCSHPVSDRLPSSYRCHDCGYLMPIYWCKCRRCSKRLCKKCAKHQGGVLRGKGGSSS